MPEWFYPVPFLQPKPENQKRVGIEDRDVNAHMRMYNGNICNVVDIMLTLTLSGELERVEIME